MRDSERPDWVGYALACRCGGDAGRLLAHDTGIEEAGQPILSSPVVFECTACHARHAFFDEALHGYDAERCLAGPLTSIGPATATCPSCRSDHFRLTALFSYEYELSELAEWSSEARARVQDYFDCFGVDGECADCRAVTSLVSVECA